MPIPRRWLVAVLAAIVLAVAIWCLPASSAVADPAGAADDPAAAITSGPSSSGGSPALPRAVGDVLSARLSRLAQQAGSGSLPSASGVPTGQLALGTAASGPGSLARRADGRLVVEITAVDPSAATVAKLAAAGAEVLGRPSASFVVTAAVADRDLAAVAAVTGIRRVREVITPSVGGAGSVLGTAGVGAQTPPGPTCGTGVVTEGDGQLRAAEARAAFGLDGSGVPVGVLSDSFDRSPFAQTTAAVDAVAGNLPGRGNACHPTPVTVQAEVNPDLAYVPTDEGRAMLQVVHDLAPGSPLSFATAFNGEADMAQQIRDLAANGNKVIVDDVSYATEPLYQDGPIAKAIGDVTAAGATYLSAAANSNIIIDGKDVASYEATAGYRPTACPAVLDQFGAADCHDFDPGPNVADTDTIVLAPNTALQVQLGWSEPINGVTTDLDIYLVDANDPTNATGDNSESVLAGSPTGWFRYDNFSPVAQTLHLYVARKQGSVGTPRFKFLFQRPSAPTSVQWNTSQGGDIVGPTIYGHNATLAGGTVAAVRYNDSSSIEAFSSRGPATYCWQPVTDTDQPAPPLAGGCQDKQIDVAATNGGRTSFFASETAPGEFRFFGTSQSAPHVAAIAALARQHEPCRTPADVLAALRSSGRPVGTFTTGAAGSGLVDAVTAIGGLASCAPTLEIAAPRQVTEGDVVTIDWTGSGPSSAKALTSTFTQRSGPAPASIRADGPTVRRFVAPRASSTTGPTPLVFDVAATDPATGARRLGSITIDVVNSVPVAMASAPATATVARSVLLEGMSTDGNEPDHPAGGGVGRRYRWRQLDGPAVDLVPGQGATFRSASFVPIAPGRYRFELTVTDHGGTGVTSAPSIVEIDVRAAPVAHTLSGVVRDERGAPIADADVVVFNHTAAGWRAWVTKSRADGAWAITALADGARFVVGSAKAGHGTRWTNDHIDLVGLPSVAGPSSTVDFTLPAAANQRTVSGSVVTSTGAGAADVRVDLVGVNGPIGTTRTGAGGAYRFTGVTPGDQYRVRVAADDPVYDRVWATIDGRGTDIGWSRRPSLAFAARGGDAVVPPITVYRAAERTALALTVRTAGGQPVAGTEVWLYTSGRDPGFVAIVRTDAQGRAVFPDLRPDDYIAWVWATGPGASAGGAPDQWLDGIVGGPWDLSDQIADPIPLRSGSRERVATLAGPAPAPAATPAPGPAPAQGT